MSRMIFFLLFFPFSQTVEAARPIGRGFVQGEILVKFKAGTSYSLKALRVHGQGHVLDRTLGRSGYSRVTFPKGQSVQENLQAYLSDPNVEYAQPNYIYKAFTAPNDPHYSQLWGLKNSGQTIVSPGTHGAVASANPGTSGRDMGLESAWEHLTDCSSVPVAVVDSGIQYQHEDLAANMWDGGTAFPHHGIDLIDEDDDPMDYSGHGTHVAGTIAARGNNAIGSTGVCWKAKLMAVRVLDAGGSGTSESVIEGIRWAADHGAKIINMSLGTWSRDQAMEDAVDYAGNKGAILVVAAGNDGIDNDEDDPTYPCNFEQRNLICVAALDQKYNLAGFSNVGEKSVDVAAPGVNILSGWHGTETAAAPSVTSGWTMAHTRLVMSGVNEGWGYQSDYDFFGEELDILAFPAGFLKGSTAPLVDGRIYRTFDFTGADVTIFSSLVDVYFSETDDSVFSIGCKSGTGDPFDGGGKTLFEYNGDGIGFVDSTIPPECMTSQTAFGFRARNTVNNLNGAGVGALEVRKINLETDGYDVIRGTSMATPHVAGLAALVLAYNPDYTPQEAVEAVKGGGIQMSALRDKTTTGKAVHALGSLAFIQKPSGGKAEKVEE